MRSLKALRNSVTELEKLVGSMDAQDFSEYRDEPVRFCEEVLGETLTEDVQGLMESVRDFPVTVARSANAVGKTHGASRLALWWFLSFPESQVYTGAAPPEANLRNLLWGQIHSVVEKLRDLFKSFGQRDLHISRSAMSFLTGVSIPTSGTPAQREAKWSGKHAPNLLFILDEGDAIPDEVFTAVESCMTGGHARLLVLFNPRSESGEPYRMERDGRANVVTLSAFSHPNVIEGRDIIPGAVTRETTVRRINEWTRPLAPEEPVDSECFILPDFLVGATAEAHDGTMYPPLKPGHYKVMEASFSYMVLGQYPSQSTNQLISREWLLKARERYEEYVRAHGETLPAHVQAKGGLDVAEFGSDLNALIFRYSNGFVPRPVTWGGLDPFATGNKAAEEVKKRNIKGLGVDGVAIGAGVAPHMRTLGVNAVAVRTFEGPRGRAEIGEFGTLRDEIWWRAREWLRTDPTAMLPNDERLFEELLVPTYEIKGGKIRIMPKDAMKEQLRRSPDRADALTLTFYEGGLFGGSDLS
jgi:hypothetical protein